ncbi:hypothetical protein PG993_007379 [Apiospora rasikravindrae]|uniref:Uncharacterized protein n=1 Tax=Apiospora rasikravindrae TaxID=990691 RepID=A0ABR1SXC7_9PEZI
MASPQTGSTVPGPLASNRMTKLSTYVSFYEPAAVSDLQQTSSATATDSQDPKLILIASWMGAQDMHIAKYVTQYQKLYPTSRILLVKFVCKLLIFESLANDAVHPAVTYLRSQVDSGYLAASPVRPQILMHVFSNGGMASTKHLLGLYRKETCQTFPLHCAVYDSCPGLWTYIGGYNAVMAGVPKGIWRWIISPFLHVLNFYFMIVVNVLRRPYNLAINANFHNNKEEVRQSNRAYIYGQKDKMVEWTHVERHAQQARDKGYDVRTELFTDSPHVAHMRTDETRYLGIVKETWEEAARKYLS